MVFAFSARRRYALRPWIPRRRLPAFDAPYAPDDAGLIRRFIAETRLDAAAEARIDERARAFIDAIRDQSGLIGGLEDFLREYSLSTREGLALMVLAEALLRVPDSATQDRLIEDKLAGGDWAKHAGRRGKLVRARLDLGARPVEPHRPDRRQPRQHHLRPGPAARPAGGAHRDEAGDARPRPSLRARRDDRRGAEAGAGATPSAASAIPTTCSARGRARRPMRRPTSPRTGRRSPRSASRRARRRCRRGRASRSSSRRSTRATRR